MSDAARKWDDLRTRILTAAGLVFIGGGALLLGGLALRLLVAAVTAIMIWELVRMLSPSQNSLAIVLAALSTSVVLGPVAGFPAWAIVAVIVTVGTLILKSNRWIFALYGALILAGCFSLYAVREHSLAIAMWIVAVVVISDIAGYLVGRLVGGPKFWPKVSPKKTWSGTIGGWVGAALVGALFSSTLGGSIIFGSVILALAAQMGDIAESAIKRHVGTKDSSEFLPGHGGFLDRFDAMIAAFAVSLIFVPFLLQITLVN